MMDKKEKENKLMEKALKLFTEKGVNNTSIQDIADEAGVGVSAFQVRAFGKTCCWVNKVSVAEAMDFFRS